MAPAVAPFLSFPPLQFPSPFGRHFVLPPPPASARYIIQSLPLILVGGIGIVMLATRALQLFQSRVLHVLPFGSLGNFSLVDACIGILVSGLFMLYFGTL